jgi:hypothetical protein
MDQRSICSFLTVKGFSAQTIHKELVTVLGPDAIAFFTVTRYLRQRQFPSVPCGRSEEPPNTVIENTILDALEKPPFSSIRELAKLTCIPTITVHQHLTQLLGFVVKHLRWVLQSRKEAQKAQRLI